MILVVLLKHFLTKHIITVINFLQFLVFLQTYLCKEIKRVFIYSSGFAQLHSDRFGLHFVGFYKYLSMSMRSLKEYTNGDKKFAFSQRM